MEIDTDLILILERNTWVCKRRWLWNAATNCRDAAAHCRATTSTSDSRRAKSVRHGWQERWWWRCITKVVDLPTVAKGWRKSGLPNSVGLDCITD